MRIASGGELPPAESCLRRRVASGGQGASPLHPDRQGAGAGYEIIFRIAKNYFVKTFIRQSKETFYPTKGNLPPAGRALRPCTPTGRVPVPDTK